MRTDYRVPAGAARPWVVINVHPQRERFAIENLARQDFHTYCPMILKRVRHARKTSEVLRSLFPGYVFVQFGHEKQWRPILSTCGVRSLVRAGDELSYIQDDFITAMRQREVDGAIIKPASPYEVGQSVVITSNAFDGVIAQIVAIDEKHRLTVLLDLLGRVVKAKVEAKDVRASGA